MSEEGTASKTARSPRRNTGSGGPLAGTGIDAYGGQVIDPTENVSDLVNTAMQRQDELRMAAERRLDDLRIASERRMDEVSAVQLRRLDEVAALRAAHSRELNEAETKRIDAIRAVDVAAVGIASERAVAAANVLANQVTQSAETLRALVSTTAAASAQQATASFNQLSDRITLLERTSYEGSGKSAVVDPQMARMVDEMAALSRNMSEGQGKKDSRNEGRSNVGMIVGISGAIFAFISLIIAAVSIVSVMNGG